MDPKSSDPKTLSRKQFVTLTLTLVGGAMLDASCSSGGDGGGRGGSGGSGHGGASGHGGTGGSAGAGANMRLS